MFASPVCTPSGRYPAPRMSELACDIRARVDGSSTGSPARNCPGVAPSGHATSRASAVALSLSTASAGAGGSVRSSPMPASAMICPAQVPVSNDNCEFHMSAGVRAARESVHPSSTRVTSWSGRSSSIAPRASATRRRSSPKAGSALIEGCRVRASASAVTPA
ncbi:Uncharacterised protein [Mycobacteroides abscessus subsp. abscessus]|nr:Uncharacterised protein [Mycobacteroides abscessus subsp. abscessus]